MIRQRIRLRRAALAAFLGRLLLVVFALALVWYGLMLVLLALKASPDSVNSLSGYRSAYDFLAGLEPGDITGRVRLVAGASGLVTFLLFGYLAFKAAPRPYLARTALSLRDDERGTVSVEPRAVERVGEAAVQQLPTVTSAVARLEDGVLTLELHARRAQEIEATLRAARDHARQALQDHGLPVATVNVILTRFEQTTRRELR
jgi:hypothetical protein